MLLLLLLACNGASDDSQEDSTKTAEELPSRATPSCSPVDAMGVEIAIGLGTDVSGEGCGGGEGSLRLFVWAAGAGPLAPGAYPIELILVEGEDRPGSGELQVSEWGAVAIGAYAVTLEDGTERAGTFSAPWCEDGTMCG